MKCALSVTDGVLFFDHDGTTLTGALEPVTLPVIG
jgi:hypothetical protein